ncbi:HXXEE domain-containing protein [Actinobacillus capsulatus]|uniref:HXXEE domain-containing protein n=1 Tax=Actinobacillus capsulatus TaxID=717 RepID=UPI00035F95B7|nr:HXXEE domain-containing protein [Actinobacillus capsulatus]
MLDLFFYNWAWIGLGGAIALGALLFGTDMMRTDLSVSRFYDRYWLGWLGGIIYLPHNFEEYGINMLGQTYGFANEMKQLSQTNINDWLIVATNLPLFWIVAPLAGYLAWKKRLYVMPVGMAGFVLMNAMVHTVSAISAGGYNSGLLTSWLLFVPYGLWCFYASLQSGKRAFAITTVISVAVIYHILLMVVAIGGYVKGIIGTLPAGLIVIFGAWLCLFVWYKAEKFARPANFK